MKISQKLKAGLLGISLYLFSTATYANEVSIDPKNPKEPIPFSPIQPSDFINPETEKPFKVGELIELKYEGEIKFQGYIEELIAIMNEAEEYYNKLGISLQGNGADIVKTIFEHRDILDEQYLQALKLKATLLKDKVKQSLRNCDFLDITKLGVNIETRTNFLPTDNIDILEGTGLNADEFINRINEQQKFLCSIGYSMLEGIDSEPSENGVIDWVMNKRKNLLSDLGLSKYNQLFNMATLKKIKEYAEIAKDIQDTIERGEFPSPEKLQALRVKLNADLLPEDLQIPEIPNIPSPEIPKRSDLKLTKGKNWDFFEGEKSAVAAYASAFYEVSGNEKNQDIRGEGKVGIWVISNEVNFLYGAGAFSVGENAKCTDAQTAQSGACTYLKMTAFGQDLFDPINKFEAVSYTKKVPKAWSWDYEYKYSQDFFIGPVLVNVEAGVTFDMYLGYEVGLTMTKAHGKIITGASADMYLKAGVGVTGFSIGAGGEVLLIDGGPQLYGSSELSFDKTGVPYLSLNLNSDFVYKYLDGKIYAYAEHPWLSCSWTYGCRSEPKKYTKDIWDWEGRKGSQKIMNWGMNINPFGAKLSGTLTDQTDEDETRELAERLSIEQRKIALANLENDAIQKARIVFESIENDLNSPKNLNISNDAEILKITTQTLTGEKENYFNDLYRIIDENRG